MKHRKRQNKEREGTEWWWRNQRESAAGDVRKDTPPTREETELRFSGGHEALPFDLGTKSVG